MKNLFLILCLVLSSAIFASGDNGEGSDMEMDSAEVMEEPVSVPAEEAMEMSEQVEETEPVGEDTNLDY